MSRPECVDSIEEMVMGPHLTVQQRELVCRLRAKGLTLREIGPQVGYSQQLVRSIVARDSKRPVRTDPWEPGRGRLMLADREEISLGLRGGESFTAIAGRLGKAISTVSREVAANGGRQDYRAWQAHQRARARSRRPKRFRLSDTRLAAQVAAWLQEWWSPQEISHRLRIEFPDDPMMQVSHETIYQSLFVQGRGELRRELTRCLRTGRVKRRPRRWSENMGQLRDMGMISERPAEAVDRAVPGHWEGDLIIGKDCRSAVGTLVERTSRYVMLLHLPAGREADKVGEALRRAITTLPGHLSRSITWDQGREMGCTSGSPWPPASRSTSATHTGLGNEAPTKTPTACCASTCPREPTCPCTRPRTWTGSPTASTIGPARRWAI
jgi:IS30 family transposase